MNSLLGLLILFMCVFGVFFLQGGSVEVMLDALPAEMATILGAGIASMIVANRPETLRYVLLGIKRVFERTKWQRQDYLDTIVLVSSLLRTLKTKGPKAIEEDIENPGASQIFRNYPNLLAEKPLIDMITDTIRMMVASTGGLNAYAVEDLMIARIKLVRSHDTHATHALDMLAGALPALGIVACVLGIIKTMASIDQPPAILGGLIGAALLGTFLGVFLAYGIVEPFAKRLAQISEDEVQIYNVVRQVIVATLHGHPQPLVIEAARVAISLEMQPSFDDVFESLTSRVPKDAEQDV
jgi:chemotaxis protein MotA